MLESELPELDLEFVRTRFPAFSEPSLAGLAFFENAGGSYACCQVIDRLHRYYVQRKVQPYGFFSASRIAGEEMDESRARLAALLNVHTDELSFGPSTSQNTYILARAFAELLTPGDAIVVTDQDHEANSGVWRRLADDRISVREWHIDPESGQLATEDLTRLMDASVKLVCFPHCSNIVGQENPVAEVVAMARGVGAVTCVDGVSMAPHGLPDVGALGADIYLFSSYKTYGPHQGLMVVRRELADRLPNQAHFFNAASRYKRFTPAGPDHAQIAAAAGMADYVDELYAHHFGAGVDADAAQRGRLVARLQRAHEDRLLAPLLDILRSRRDVRILGHDHVDTPTSRVPTVALKTSRRAADVARDLASRGVGAGAGDFYAVRTLEAMGCDPAEGVLRLSFVHYTADFEVHQLIEALDAAL